MTVLSLDLRVPRPGLLVRAALDVAPGEIAVIVGPSGAGKSTIVRAVAGLLRPDAGTIRCGERTWFAAEPGQRPRVDLRPRDRRTGVVVQEGALFPHLSAWRNVAFGAPGTAPERRASAAEELERLGLGDRLDDRPAGLSGGERQRVALARALARRPTALLLDEPFSALDRTTRERAIAAVVRTVEALRIPAIVVSHDDGDAARLGARSYRVLDGTLEPSTTRDVA
jgi:molybdate transport system ATP-binding protein